MEWSIQTILPKGSSMPAAHPRPGSVALTLVELLVVIVILCVMIALLLPALSTSRRRSRMVQLMSEKKQAEMREAQAPRPAPGAPVRTAAVVSSFAGVVGLTPRLSVGTADPQSIYEATFSAHLEARGAEENKNAGDGGGPGDSEIELPMPPEIISLADLTVTVDGAPTDRVALVNDKL